MLSRRQCRGFIRKCRRPGNALSHGGWQWACHECDDNDEKWILFAKRQVVWIYYSNLYNAVRVGEGDSGGHLLRETTSRGPCGTRFQHFPARVGLVFNTSQRRKGEEGPSSSSSSLGTLEPAPLKSGIGALRRNVKFVVDASRRAGARRGGGSKMARHCRHGEEPDPGHGGDPPRPAAPRLCGPAARGRAHARRLQDPLGVHAALGGASARRYRHVETTRGQLWRRAAAGLDGADTVLRRRRPPRRRLTVSLGRY